MNERCPTCRRQLAMPPEHHPDHDGERTDLCWLRWGNNVCTGTPRCLDCDRQLATEIDYDVTPEGEGEHLCWRTWNADACSRPPSSWRARALSAERELVELRQRIERLEIDVRRLKAGHG